MNLTLSNSIKTLTRAQKLEKVLDLIEYFEVKENKVIIGLNKDIVLVSNGDMFTVTKGLNVSFAEQIHFNPNISPNEILKDDFAETLSQTLKSEQGCLTKEP